MVFIDIKTNLWNDMLKYCRDNGWRVLYRYDQFDAGIDFDLVILRCKGKLARFGWSNWVEGEIECSYALRRELEECFHIVLKEGDPDVLKPTIVHRFFKDKEMKEN